jgi:hypothetical protein
LLFFILTVVSVSGNGMVIFIFLKVKSLRTSSNMLIVSLALSDMMMMVTEGFPVFINCFFSRWWAFGALLCKIYAFCGGVFGTWSLILIILIGYDRYNVIVKGRQYLL